MWSVPNGNTRTSIFVCPGTVKEYRITGTASLLVHEVAHYGYNSEDEPMAAQDACVSCLVKMSSGALPRPPKK